MRCSSRRNTKCLADCPRVQSPSSLWLTKRIPQRPVVSQGLPDGEPKRNGASFDCMITATCFRFTSEVNLSIQRLEEVFLWFRPLFLRLLRRLRNVYLLHFLKVGLLAKLLLQGHGLCVPRPLVVDLSIRVVADDPLWDTARFLLAFPDLFNRLVPPPSPISKFALPSSQGVLGSPMVPANALLTVKDERVYVFVCFTKFR